MLTISISHTHTGSISGAQRYQTLAAGVRLPAEQRYEYCTGHSFKGLCCGSTGHQQHAGKAAAHGMAWQDARCCCCCCCCWWDPFKLNNARTGHPPLWRCALPLLPKDDRSAFPLLMPSTCGRMLGHDTPSTRPIPATQHLHVALHSSSSADCGALRCLKRQVGQWGSRHP